MFIWNEKQPLYTCMEEVKTCALENQIAHFLGKNKLEKKIFTFENQLIQVYQMQSFGTQ